MLDVRAGGGAVVALAEERCVAWLDRELVGGENGFAEVIEDCSGDVDDRSAGVADQVDVAALVELIERGAGAGVNVLDHSEFVESAEHAVDRGR